MISWRTTVAPQTAAVESYILSEVRRRNPGAEASITVTYQSTTVVSEIWSKTFTEINTNKSVFQLGTTNSTVYQTLSNGNENNPSVTSRRVVNETITETTREYTFRPTATNTSYTITIGSFLNGSNVTFGEIVPTTITYTSTFASDAAQTTSETCYSITTVAQETIATPIWATILVADKNEIIMTASTTAATNITGLVAASSVAVAVTRATIMPWTQTIAGIQADTSETEEVPMPAISAVISFSYTAQSPFNRTVVQNYQYLPHQTSVQASYSRSLLESVTMPTVSPAQTILKTKSAETATIQVVSTTTALAFLNGSSFITSAQRNSTIARTVTLPTALTCTYSFLEPVTYYGSSNSDGEFPDSYVWNQSFKYTTLNQLTTFARRLQGITTSMAQPMTSYEGRGGVLDANGNVLLGYTMETTLGSGFTAYPVSRNASSAFPSSGIFVNDYGVPLTVTISNLEASIKTPSTTITDQLVPFGNAFTVFGGPGPWKSKIDPAGLGKSETIFITLPEGVYSRGDSTFSTTGTTMSVGSNNQSSEVPIPISFIVPTTAEVNADKIWWTVSRNSHDSMAGLTNAAAYSAS